MLWLQENRAAITERTEGKGVAAVGKQAGEEWRAMTDKDKKVWTDRAAALKDGTATAPVVAAKKDAPKKKTADAKKDAPKKKAAAGKKDAPEKKAAAGKKEKHSSEEEQSSEEEEEPSEEEEQSSDEEEPAAPKPKAKSGRK